MQFRYTNPITSDPILSLRDHQILKVGDLWYMTGTSQPIWSGPNPGVKLLVSRDLLQWEIRCWLIDASSLPLNCLYNGRFWAPEIHQAHGRFYLTVNSGYEGPQLGVKRMDGHNIHLFVSDQIDGEYRKIGGALGEGFKNDATLFTDDNGRSYIYCSGGGLWQAEIDLRKGSLIGRAFEKICSPKDAGLPDWMIGGIEGPFVIKRDELYHMFFSAWTRGYETGVMTAPTPLGPWKIRSNSPIFGTRKRAYREAQMKRDGYDHLVFDDTKDPFVEVGHGAVFQGPDGKDWYCCHYFLKGDKPIPDSPILEYEDTLPQLGFEPLHYSNGLFSIQGPTWTEQVVNW